MTTEYLNIASFLKNSRVVGPGIRDALWVQGCSILCPGCANQSYLSHKKKNLISVDRILKHFEKRVNEIEGISVLGGEPTEQVRPLSILLEGIKLLGLTTVVFTGRIYEDLLKEKNPYTHKMLSFTDLLIDGPFIQSHFDETLNWRGSTNQKIIPLSDIYKNVDKYLNQPNGEIVINENSITINGIGTINLNKCGFPKMGIIPDWE